MRYKYHIRDIQRVHQGRFAVDRLVVDHDRFDGTQAQGVVREVFDRGNSVAVMLYDPLADALVWVEQFRAGLAAAEKLNPWSLEPVAGSLEGPDDDPLQRIRAECQEEIGAVPSDLFKISGFYPSPGACSEYIHMFFGLIDSTTVGQHGGLREHHEDIRVRVVPYWQSVTLLDSGTLTSGPAVAGMLWLMANRGKINTMTGRSDVTP